jgi:signal transduction histidine kinase
LLDAAARSLAAISRGGANSPEAVARARARGQAVAAAGGDTPESRRAGALAFAADLIVSTALERDWLRPEIAKIVHELAGSVELPPKTVGSELFARAVGDPRFLDPLPQLVETQLRVLTAFCSADDASIWLARQDDGPELLAAVGADPTRGIRSAAQAATGAQGATVGRAIRAIPIVRWENVEGVLMIRVAKGDAQYAAALAAELAPRLAPALERARVLARTRQREAAVIEATEKRLARLGFDLHDGPLQEIFALGAELRLFRDQLRGVLGSNRSAPIILGRVDDIEARLTALEAELREFARSLESPAALRTPLPALLEKEKAEFEQRSDVRVLLSLVGDFDALTGSQTIALLRVVQEALANVESHSGATTASVTVEAAADELRAEIVDDGRGFDVERTLVEAARAGRLGLVGMSERTRLLDGRLDVESRPGGPTRVAAAIPRWRPGD